MRSIKRKDALILLGAMLLVVFMGHMSISAKETQEPLASSELGIATLSPRGEAGGMLVPASGCSGGGCSTSCEITVSPNPVEPDSVFNVTIGDPNSMEASMEATQEFLGDFLGIDIETLVDSGGVAWVALCDSEGSFIFNNDECSWLSPQRSQNVDSTGLALGSHAIKARVQAGYTECTYGNEGGCTSYVATANCSTTFEIAENEPPGPESEAGQCGTAAQDYAYDDSAYSGSFCSTGTASPSSPSFPDEGSSESWVCQGVNGGANASCTATRDSDPNEPGGEICIEPDFSASPTIVRSGEGTTVTWSNPDTLATCELYRNGVATGYVTPPTVCDDSRSEVFELSNTTDFDLICTSLLSPSYDPDTVTVRVVPVYDQN